MLQTRQLILIALVAVPGVSASTQEPPRDPGAIVLLASSEGHTADVELRQALMDPQPRVRLIAARVAAAGDHRELLGNVVSALLREQDVDTGAELIRSALHLGGERDMALIERQAKRLGTRALVAKAEWQARSSPEQFLAALPGMANEIEYLVSLVDMAAAQHPSLQSRIVEAWNGIAPAHLKATNDSVRMGPEGRRSRRPTARTINLARGTVAAALEAAGCRAVNEIGEAEVSYRPDGRPRRITLTRGRLVPACVNALSALARVSFADSEYPITKDPQTLVLPLHNTYVQCDTQPAGRTVPVQDLDPDKVVQPTLKREVKPDYSRAAMDHRIEGVVELSAQVTEHGCVASAEVLSGLPYLDVQALLAVTQWRFKPAQFEGAGVPTRVGIELTFKLK